MSNLSSIDWLSDLLFGNSEAKNPPSNLYEIVIKLESQNLDWHQIIQSGGLTAFPHQVNGDLQMILDNLEKELLQETEAPFENFRTRSASRFWNPLRLLLARKLAKPPEAPLVPVPKDDDILKDLLSNHPSQHHSYVSANFWGNVARQLINVRRNMNELTAEKLPFSFPVKDVVLLYTVTCESQGQYWDPLSMYLLPRSNYVDSVHWQTSHLLENFLQKEPSHPLAKSIQNLLQQSVQQLLEGNKPSALFIKNPQLESFLHNIEVIHRSVPEVLHRNEPPKMVDVFQRLLALCYKDYLWEKFNPPREKIESQCPTGMDFLILFERLESLERENKLLRKQLIDNSKFDSGQL